MHNLYIPFITLVYLLSWPQSWCRLWLLFSTRFRFDSMLTALLEALWSCFVAAAAAGVSSSVTRPSFDTVVDVGVVVVGFRLLFGRRWNNLRRIVRAVEAAGARGRHSASKTARNKRQLMRWGGWENVVIFVWSDKIVLWCGVGPLREYGHDGPCVCGVLGLAGVWLWARTARLTGWVRWIE